MASPPRVLFLCTGNSCRSQMAEGWLRHLAKGRLVSLSAGTQAHGLNPHMVESMAAAGIDTSEQRSETLDAYLGDPPELVITVCDNAAAVCPTLPGTTQVLHWPFPDPAGATGDPATVAAVFATVRDTIRDRLGEWIDAGAPLPSGELLIDCASPS